MLSQHAGGDDDAATGAEVRKAEADEVDLTHEFVGQPVGPVVIGGIRERDEADHARGADDGVHITHLDE